MYLSRVRIANFRCLASADLKLEPITVIYGFNGSGKSSILAAIQLMKQSIDNERLVSKGTLNVGSFRDYVRDSDVTQWVSIGLEISFEKDEFLNRMVFSNLDKVVQRIRGATLPIRNAEYSISYRESGGFPELGQVLKLNGTRIIETKSFFERGSLQSKLVAPEIPGGYSSQRQILGESLGYFDFIQSEAEREHLNEHMEIRNWYGGVVRDIVRMFRSVLNNYFVIGPTRAAKSFETDTPSDPGWVGYEGEGITGVLSKIWGNAALSQKREKISRWAKVFGLPDVWAGFQGGTKLGVTFKDEKTGTPVSLDWAGHGSKQMLVLIAQMFYGSEGEIVALEEPEISLHLGLQIELPKLFTDVIREKKQVIVTSHSSQFLTAFRESFRNHLLSAKDLAVYHLEKTRKGTIAERLKVTREGIVVPFVPSIAKAEKKLVSEAFS